MPGVPGFLLKKLYQAKSLAATNDGFSFALKNTLASAIITQLVSLSVDGAAIDQSLVTLAQGESRRSAASVSVTEPLLFTLNSVILVQVSGQPPAPGKHKLVIGVRTKEAGEVKLDVEDSI